MKSPARFLFAVLLPLVAGSLHAQPERAAALLDEAERIHGRDDAKSRALLHEALDALAKRDQPGLQARARLLACRWADSSADAYRAAEAGLRAAARAGDAAAEGRLRLCRGTAFYLDERYEDAEREFLEAARAARTGADAATEADALRHAGSMRYNRGATADALADLQTAYRINARLGRELERLDTLSIIANVYAEPTVAQYDRAIEHYQAILRDYQRLNRISDVADTLFNLASTLQKKGEIAKALEHYRRAVTLFEQAGKPSDAAFTRRAIGTALVKAGRPAEALPWFERALQVFDAAGEAEESAATRQARGAAFRKLGRDADAVRDLEQVRPFFEREKNNRFLERIYEDLSASYAALGRWREAHAAQERRAAVQRALFEAQRDEHAARLRVEFDTERREEENRALARENALRAAALESARRIARLQKVAIALTVLLALALALLFWRQLVQSRRMRVMALTDELTRLPNRRHVLAVAEEAFGAAVKSGRPLSVIAFDIDRFKRINDTWGHDTGDAVLRRVSHVCRTALRPADVIGRTGGEEFLVVLPETSEQEAVDIAERLRRSVEATDFSDVEAGLVVTISLGVNSLARRPERLEALLRAADELLYEAKGSGRNRVVAAAPA